MNNFFLNKRVLVTGGAGFIGSHVSTALVDRGALVTVLDNLATSNVENLAAIKNRITFIQGSITDNPTCLRATEGVSHVFHLAAFISVPQSIEKPLECYEVNVNGTANLLEACRVNTVERFIFSSSSAVYGNASGICNEQTPLAPTSPYGFSKLIGEEYCRYYAQQHGVKTVCLRYFNVYGELQNPLGSYAAVVAKFRHQLQHNLPITIFGDGRQTRDFIPVDQVVEANLLMAQLPASSLSGEPYNIATGRSISLLELFARLKQEYPHSTSPLLFAPARAGDILHSGADCTRYREAAARRANCNDGSAKNALQASI